MDPELKKQLDAIRESLQKNVDAVARIDALEQKLLAGETSDKLVRAELDTIKQTVSERENTIRELREAARTQRTAADPLKRREEGLAMLGMIVRQEMSRFNHMEVPTQFRAETDLVRKYREEVLARATVTPMATTGSYLVPTVTDTMIQDALEEVSELLGLIDFLPGLPAGGTFNFTFLSSRPAMQPKRASTDTAMTQSDPVFAQLQLQPQETYVFFPVDNKLYLMSAVALGGYFEGLCRDAMADKLSHWLLRADGSASYNSITGMLAETAADYVYSLPAGKTGFADLADTDLTRIKAKNLKRGRGQRARWIMDLEIQGLIENMNREGKAPVIREQPDGSMRIKQNEVVIEEYMPGLDESAAATAFLGYGDPATFIAAMVGGIQIASDTSVRFDKNQTCFRGTTIVDIKRKPVKTFTVAKTAAGGG
jgi:HK97 family phage major capsid protein